jgi:hypothetical protein
VALLTVLALFAGCSGGDSKDDAKGKGDKREATPSEKRSKERKKRDGEGDVSAAGTGEQGGAISGNGVTPTTATANGGQSGQPTVPPSVPAGENPFKPRKKRDGPLPLTVTVASPCVKSGGIQTVTIKSDPETPVIYATSYSDGKTGTDDGQGYGGSNAGFTGETGKYNDSFTVSPQAPSGTAKVQAFANNNGHNMATAEATFEVAGPLGTCD